MTMRRYTVSITTDGSGDATSYTQQITGKLHAIHYVKHGSSPYSNSVDFTITNEITGEALLSKSNVSASAQFYPRVATQDNAGAASLYAAGGTPVLDRAPLVAPDRVKFVLAQGGNTNTGTFYVYIEV